MSIRFGYKSDIYTHVTIHDNNSHFHLGYFHLSLFLFSFTKFFKLSSFSHCFRCIKFHHCKTINPTITTILAFTPYIFPSAVAWPNRTENAHLSIIVIVATRFHLFSFWFSSSHPWKKDIHTQFQCAARMYVFAEGKTFVGHLYCQLHILYVPKWTIHIKCFHYVRFKMSLLIS